MAEQETKTYRIRHGYTHGANRQYKAGDTVELTDEAARPIMDKLIAADAEKRTTDVPQTSLQSAIANAKDDELNSVASLTTVESLRNWASGEAEPEVAEPDYPTSRGQTIYRGDENKRMSVDTADAAKLRSQAAKDAEAKLEAETGTPFTQTGSNPTTFAETENGGKRAGTPRRT